MTEAKNSILHPIVKLKTSLISFKLNIHDLMTREKAPWYALIAIALIYGVGIFSHGMQNMDYFVIWTRDFVQGNLLAEYHINNVTKPGTPVDLTVPYTPLSLYFIGAIAKILLLVLPDQNFTYSFSVNLASVAATFGIFFLLRKWNSSPGSFPAWLYLISPAVVLATPILGYQDSIMTFFIIAALMSAQSEKIFLSGGFAGLAVMSKQLAAMPMFGLFVAVVLTTNLRQISKWIIAGTSTVVITLLPFIVTGHLISYLKAQALASVHTMLSAQAANFPWAASFIYRLLTLPISEAQKLGGDVLEIQNESARRLIYAGLAVLCITVFLISIIYVKQRQGISKYFHAQAASLMYLSYYLFGAGVHENHIYPLLAMLAIQSSSPHMKKAFLLSNLALTLQLLNYYGVGRSFTWLTPIHSKWQSVSEVLVLVSIYLFTKTYLLIMKTKT